MPSDSIRRGSPSRSDELTRPVDRLPAIPSYELSGVVADGVGAGEEVFALTPFDRDGVAAEYAVVPASVLAPKPRTLTHIGAASAISPCSSSGRRSPPKASPPISSSTRSAASSCAGRSGRGARVVSVAEEADGAVYFVVEPNREQLVELATRADAGDVKPAIDSVFPLEEAAAAFARVAERGKRGKVVLDLGA